MITCCLIIATPTNFTINEMGLLREVLLSEDQQPAPTEGKAFRGEENLSVLIQLSASSTTVQSSLAIN